MFEPSQAYRAPNGFVWIVSTVFEGPADMITRKSIDSGTKGVVLFRVEELGRREFVFADDPRLDKLKRIHGAAEELVDG